MAYYIESLTKLAEKSIITFQRSGKSSGFIKQLSEGNIQKKNPAKKALKKRTGIRRWKRNFIRNQQIS
jgi:hypothetical protein